MNSVYEVIARDGRAKTAVFKTVHGFVNTPVFMNVATAGVIKGAVDVDDLYEIESQMALSNTYHLHVRPGDEVIRKMGGLHKYANWDKPILTDSGGFQVFSLSSSRKINEEGVIFNSHVDGRRIFMGPRESIEIQSNLGSTVAMAFDECPPALADRKYVIDSVNRTTRWLVACKKRMEELNSLPDTVNPNQLLFAINQGAVFTDIRREHARTIRDMDFFGYAIGGLAVGESHEQMYEVLDHVCEELPSDKPTYLMGVGTPENMLEAISRGVDFFDCVYPTRNGRHGHVYTFKGKLNLHNEKFKLDNDPIEEGCDCPACKMHSRGYIRHLLKSSEMLGYRLCTLHNLRFYNRLMEGARTAISDGRYGSFMKETIEGFKQG